MVIDFTEAVSATKYLSVNSDNADKVFILSSKLLIWKNLSLKVYMLICMLSKAGWQKSIGVNDEITIFFFFPINVALENLLPADREHLHTEIKFSIQQG